MFFSVLSVTLWLALLVEDVLVVLRPHVIDGLRRVEFVEVLLNLRVAV